MKKFVADSEKILADIEDLNEVIDGKLMGLVKYFGEKKMDDAPVLLDALANFREFLEVAMDENAADVADKKKKAEVAAKKAAKAAKAAAKKAAAQ